MLYPSCSNIEMYETSPIYNNRLYYFFNRQNGILPYRTGTSRWAQELSFYIGRKEAMRYLTYLAKNGDD